MLGQKLLMASGDGGLSSFDLGITTTGGTYTVGGSSRAFCFDRDDNFGYTGKIWWYNGATVNDPITQYEWNGSTWATTGVSFLSGSTNVLGMADNGSILLYCDSIGEIRRYNKSTGTVTLIHTNADNLQGVLWDGLYFYCGSFTTTANVYRVNSPNAASSTVSTFTKSPNPSVANRGAAYDFNRGVYIFSAGTTVYEYTLSGTTFSETTSYARTFGAADELDYFEQSDGTKWLIEQDATQISPTKQF